MLTEAPKHPSSLDVRAVRQEPLRILHVLEATLGGTLRYVENIATSMERSPFHFGFAYGAQRADSRLVPFLETARTQGWELFPVDMHRAVLPGEDWLAFRQLQGVIRNFRPHLIHCHSSKAGILGRVAARLTRPHATVLYSPHALAIPLGRQYLYIERWLRSLVDCYVAVSHSEASDISRYKVAPPQKVRIVFPAIDAATFFPRDRNEARESLGLPDGPLVIGLGRLTAQKDPLGFLRIVKRVTEQITCVRAMWIGDGDLTAEFLRTRESLGLQDVVRLVSWQHDVRTHLAAADVLLSTSIYESFGYMVAESMAMAIPAVAPAVSGPRDILADDLSGWLYPPGEESAAATRLVQLLTDPAAASDLGLLGRKAILRRFTPEAMAQSLEELYREQAALHGMESRS